MHSSLEKFLQLELSGHDQSLIFLAEYTMSKFVAFIAYKNRFSTEDKLSQVITLQQLQNIASYSFLRRRLESHDLHIHALWFDIYSGDIFYFSRQHKKFIEINELTIYNALHDGRKCI